MDLFRERGFTTLITNGLVCYVLGVSCWTIGFSTGAAAILVDFVISKHFNAPDSEFESFLFGPVPGSTVWVFA
jgi:hypothetical protein